MNLDKLVSHSVSLSSYGNTKRTMEEPVDTQTKKIEKKALLHHNKTMDSVNIDAEEIEMIVDQLNGFIDPTRTNTKFVFHEELNRYYVTLVDPLTDETIKEIPSRKMLDMYASMAEFMGLLIDQKI